MRWTTVYHEGSFNNCCFMCKNKNKFAKSMIITRVSFTVTILEKSQNKVNVIGRK